MTKFRPLHGMVFVFFICLALFICVQHNKSVQRQRAEKTMAEEKQKADQAAQAQKDALAAATADDQKRKAREAEERQAAIAKAAEIERQKYLGYLNTNIIRNPGEQLIAVACISENDTMNSAIADALAQHFKQEHVKVVSSLFRPSLIADGLFDDLFNGSKNLFNKLELEKSVDGLLLARQEVDYSTNNGLDGLITASMRVQVTTQPVAAQIESQSWTLSANGAGYNKSDARSQAEERIVHQIANNTAMSLTEFSTNK